jgi:DNA-binding CsgD family transcriptional regulator
LLGTSPNTVKNQIGRIFNKLQVTTRAGLAAVARSTVR